jgi:hypothetical protein
MRIYGYLVYEPILLKDKQEFYKKPAGKMMHKNNEIYCQSMQQILKIYKRDGVKKYAFLM